MNHTINTLIQRLEELKKELGSGNVAVGAIMAFDIFSGPVNRAEIRDVSGSKVVYLFCDD